MMRTAHSERVMSRRTDRGMEHYFPARDLGKARWVGLIPLGMSCVMGWFTYAWVRSALDLDSGEPFTVDPFGLLCAAFVLPLAAMALLFLLIGAGLCLNALQAEVWVGNKHLTAVERFGPFAWKRRRKIDGIRKLVLTRAPTTEQEAAAGQALGTVDLVALRAEGEGIKPMIIAPGYSRNLLEPLAVLLAQQVNTAAPAGRHVEGAGAVQVEREDLCGGAEAAEDDPRALVQPEGSDIRFEETAEGCSIVAPPAGLRKGSHGLFTFGVLWTLVLGTVFVVILAVEGPERPPLVAFCIVGVMMAVGVGLLAGGYAMGKRSAAIVVSRDRLFIKRISPFGTSSHEFGAQELETIRMGPSGTEINERPINELQIVPREGKKYGLLSQRRDDELAWIAAVLRHRLGVAGE